MFLVTDGDFDRSEILTQHAFGGAGLLDLGNYRSNWRATTADFRADCADEVPRRRLHFGFCADGGEGLHGLGRGDFLALDGEDLVEDVAHANLRVNCTNSSTLALAAPLAMTSRALTMPSPIEATRFAV